jgi:hypothetical protein
MRIPRELTEYLGSLFGPQNTTSANRSSAKAEDSFSGRFSPADVDTSEKTFDRVTLSNDAVAAAATLASPTSLRKDIPPVAIPAPNPHPADLEQTADRNDGLVSIRALAPVTDGAGTPRQQEEAATMERETPETRRLVRRVYGSSQAPEKDQVLQSDNRIRIRA